MSKKHKKECKVLIYLEHDLILAFTVSTGVSKSVLTSLVGLPTDIASSVVGLKICAITAGSKTYNYQENEVKA